MTFERVWDVFSALLGDFGSVVIAGGSVRDQLLGREAKDFDLFILCDKREFEFGKIKKEIEPRIAAYSRRKPQVDWHMSEPYLVASIDFEGSEVQIMVNPATSLEGLIATFDWSVCLFGYDGYRILKLSDLSEIKVGGKLTLQKCTFPLSTLRRGFRFSERFKMKLDNDEIAKLCNAFLDNRKRGADIGPDGNEPDQPALAAQQTEENPF